jgi:putative Mn2+ efflux pump MntP
MTLFRSKVWSPVDIASLKWSCIFLGMIGGAYLSAFVKDYVWVFAIAVILLGIKPTVSYFRADQTDK